MSCYSVLLPSEIAYTIFEAYGKKVVVLLAGTRENFYKELKRLYKK